MKLSYRLSHNAKIGIAKADTLSLDTNHKSNSSALVQKKGTLPGQGNVEGRVRLEGAHLLDPITQHGGPCLYQTLAGPGLASWLQCSTCHHSTCLMQHPSLA